MFEVPGASPGAPPLRAARPVLVAFGAVQKVGNRRSQNPCLEDAGICGIC